MANENLREVVTSASADLGGKSEVADTKADNSTSTTEPEWEGPGWLSQWKKPSREAMRSLRKMEGAQPHVDAALKEIEERYDYTGKQAAEFDKYRKRFDPYDQVLSGLEQRFALQGVHGATGLQQMAAINDLLARDPDQGMAYLAQMFSPRDAKALIQSLSQRWNVDLAGVAQGQPWVDPAVSQRFSALEQQNQQLMQFLQGSQQQQYNQAASAVAEAIKAFKESKDESGEPKYPHYERLEQRMTAILRATGNRDLASLYQEAMWGDPELREEIVKQRAEQANKQAIQAAKESNAQAEKALSASRNVNGSKPAPSPRKHDDLREAIRETSKRLASR